MPTSNFLPHHPTWVCFKLPCLLSPGLISAFPHIGCHCPLPQQLPPPFHTARLQPLFILQMLSGESSPSASISGHLSHFEFFCRWSLWHFAHLSEIQTLCLWLKPWAGLLCIHSTFIILPRKHQSYREINPSWRELWKEANSHWGPQL